MFCNLDRCTAAVPESSSATILRVIGCHVVWPLRTLCSFNVFSSEKRMKEKWTQWQREVSGGWSFIELKTIGLTLLFESCLQILVNSVSLFWILPSNLACHLWRTKVSLLLFLLLCSGLSNVRSYVKGILGQIRFFCSDQSSSCLWTVRCGFASVARILSCFQKWRRP